MKKKLFSLSLIPLLLTGCSNAIKLEFVPFSDFIESQDLMRDVDNEYFYSHKEASSITVHGGTQITSITDLLENNRLGKKRENIISKGERKLLVLPIYFNDSDTSSLDAKTVFIQNAFFGKTDHTTYDSVAGYYNKSSYGQLKLSGEVAPWYHLDRYIVCPLKRVDQIILDPCSHRFCRLAFFLFRSLFHNLFDFS